MLVDAIERESCVVHMVVSLSHVLFRVRHFSPRFSPFSVPLPFKNSRTLVVIFLSRVY